MVVRYILPVWLNAGIAIERNGEWSMDRELPLRGWWVPGQIELDEENDRLIWSNEGGHPADGPTEGVLTEFVRLASGSARSILNYAARWGVLELCEHDLPRSHNPPAVMPGGLRVVNCGRVRLERESDPVMGPFVEPLEVWRALADRVKAIVNLAALLDNGEPGAGAEWLVAMGVPDADPRGPHWKGSPFLLARQVQELLDIGNVRPLFRWKGGANYGVEIGVSGAGMAGNAIRGSGLFGGIATQLAFALSRADGLAICSGCGNAYSVSEGRPRTGERRYCKACRDAGVPARDRQRKYREQKKSRHEGEQRDVQPE